MTSRATILKRAYGRIGIADYEFDVQPDERADARLMLDAMMAEWEGEGKALGYTPSDGTDNDAVLITTPTWADGAIWSNLALRLAPDYGKTVTAELRREAKRGYDLVSAKTLVVPTDVRATKRILGGGDRFYRRFGF